MILYPSCSLNDFQITKWQQYRRVWHPQSHWRGYKVRPVLLVSTYIVYERLQICDAGASLDEKILNHIPGYPRAPPSPPKEYLLRTLDLSFSRIPHPTPKNENCSGLWIWVCQEYPPKIENFSGLYVWACQEYPPSWKWKLFITLDLSLPIIAPPPLCAGNGCVETSCRIPHGYGYRLVRLVMYIGW